MVVEVRVEECGPAKGIAMKPVRYVGRMGGLAVALGTGAWLASVPWTAAADPDASGLGALSDLLIPAAADPSGLNIDISYNDMDVFHMGDATAQSGTGDLAIAYGDGANAEAGTGSTSTGLSLVGQHDTAFADGSGSTAISGAGDYDSATASNGATAYSGLFIGNGVQSTGGSDDVATASGAGSTADAMGQSGNIATASDGGTADSGFYDEALHLFNGGIGDYASATGEGSTAAAGFGNSDLADVFGTNSTALAGGFDSLTGTAGNSDIAEAFGNDLTANAATGSNLFDFEPSVFTAAATDAAATVAPADDFGLSSLGLEGLAPGLESLLNLF
jgi:hypothetical protein